MRREHSTFNIQPRTSNGAGLTHAGKCLFNQEACSLSSPEGGEGRGEEANYFRL